MTALEELNRAVNRALRALNALALRTASSALPDRDAGLREITQALAHVDSLQRLIVAADPGLEYHHDPNRPPSRIMREIANVVEEAEKQVRAGNVARAMEMLQRAQSMEPPPLAYESIEKRLMSLKPK